MEASTFLLVTLALGYVVGLLSGGIHININQPEKIIEKEPEKPKYNEVYTDHMDPEARAYLEKHNGQVKF